MSRLNYFFCIAGDCSAGYFCQGNASTPSTPDGVSIIECPEGEYCELGTTNPTPCSIGTWSNSTGLATQSECQDCIGGHYCDSLGQTQPTGLCSEGYYCSSGASTSTPTDGVTGDQCTAGHYCPNGTTVPIQCAAGTYMQGLGASSCLPCTAGFFCIDGYNLTICPVGYYCPEGTGHDQQSCPVGTFSNFTGLIHEDNCTQCSEGMYCDSLAAVQEAGTCNQGFYCLSGAESATPVSGGTANAGVCPAGSYCPAGTGNPIPCPRGTYSNTTQLTQDSECTDCPNGQYCGTTGLTAPTDDCDPGYYCLTGSKQKQPPDGATGGECPVSHYCPAGTSDPIPCAAGTYNPNTQQASCFSCQAGFYCPQNITDFTIYPCPFGHYCPTGTTFDNQYPCPQGTYNDLQQQQDLSDCKLCEPGKYCNSTGLDQPSGDCREGWYCVSGAQTDQPTDIGNYTASDCVCPTDLTGGECQIGQYCPAGSSSPTECTGGRFNSLILFIYRGSYMSACVLSNLLNKLGKNDKMQEHERLIPFII